MEIVSDNKGRAEFIQDIINGFGISSRIIQRKKYSVVYLKDGEMIVEMLGLMGAHISLMDMENIRIKKDIRNTINRRVNCEAANLNKTVSAAVKQVNDINYIISTKGIEFLPENLQELALARLESDDATLTHALPRSCAYISLAVDLYVPCNIQTTGSAYAGL